MKIEKFSVFFSVFIEILPKLSDFANSDDLKIKEDLMLIKNRFFLVKKKAGNCIYDYVNLFFEVGTSFASLTRNYITILNTCSKYISMNPCQFLF